MKNISRIMKRATLFTATSLLLAANFLVMPQAHAASLTNTDLRLNRMTAATATSARLVFKTSASITGTNLSINMNGADSTPWGSGNVNATQTVSSAICAAETGATALPGTLAAAGASGTITISGVTTLANSTLYCVDLTSASALTTPAAGEYHPLITVGNNTNLVALRVVTNDSVVVTAVVPPSFNFVLGGNTDAFITNLTTGGVVLTNGITATINTNAKTGWTVWAKDTNTGLNSVATGKTIASTTPGTSATLAAGAEGYTSGITAVTQGTGVGVTSLTSAYDATGSASGSGLDATFRQVASSTGSAAGAVLTFKEQAAINVLTPAANDYSDTIIIIASAKF